MKISASHIIHAAAVAATLTFAALPQVATAAPADAQDAVRNFYQVLLATMQNGSALGASGRYAKLSPTVLHTFDIAFMTRMSVGPSWANLPDAEKQALTDAFGHYVTATWAKRFESYSGQRLEVTGEQPYGAEQLVATQIVPKDGAPTSINYLMRQNNGEWQIADVYLSGTVSQLAVERSEFSSVLNSDGPDALIMKLNQKATTLAENVVQ
jgi:phospholipid transport system substrate-binding protein